MKGKEQEHNKDDSKDGSSHIDLIPMDLTMEILTRLPVESLLKFQYVSKTWFFIIRSKYFIDSSVYNIFQEPSSRLLISFKNGELVNNSSVKYLFFFTSSQEEEESSSLVAILHMTMISMDAYIHTRYASLNGFICLSFKGRFMICNPSTRQVITLPEIADTSWKCTYRYLGYDPVDDQYKAMCKRVLNKENDHEHMVLTLGSDKKLSWRRITDTIRDYYALTNGICINGFVYYVASDSVAQTCLMIVCFDVRSERLSIIRPPMESMVAWKPTSTLINYKGKLAILNFRCSELYCKIELWIEEDVKKIKWLRKAHSFLRSENHVWWDSLCKVPISFQGTNQAGEVVISPEFLPLDRIFYILYCDID